MATAKVGDLVKVHYTGMLDNGAKFDSSIGGEPLEFKIGDGHLIRKFEEAVVGLQPNESFTVKILPEDAYGIKKNELIVSVPKNQLPPEIVPELGMKLQMRAAENETIVLKIIEVMEDSIKVDANHELAGENLTFEIQLVSIAE
jgi:peptidylprolyl isomerase